MRLKKELHTAAKEEGRKKGFGFQRFVLLTFTLVTEHHMESFKQTCAFIFITDNTFTRYLRNKYCL